MGLNYLCISSSPSLELWPGWTVVFFHSHPRCLGCVSAALAHLLPSPGSPQASEQLPRTDLCSWECMEASEPLALPAGPVPCSSVSCLSENTPVPPHQGSEQDSGQHCHCFNPAQVTCMTDLSWAPSTPPEPHWGVLGALSILKNRPGSRERKGKQFPSCSADS